MSQLLESIRFENGQFYNLGLHEARMQRALQKIFNSKKSFDLQKEITIPNNISKDKYKCRILYDTNILDVKFSKYKRKNISRIKLVVDEKISYSHKFADRENILRHTKNLLKGEELVFVKKGLVRDASYSNIALFNGVEWHTPTYPLLKGTKRQELINKQQIISKKILAEDLFNYDRVSFINALNGLDELILKL